MTMEQKTALVQECSEAKEHEGCTVKRWCASKGIACSTYYNWVRQIAKKAASQRAGVNMQQEIHRPRQWAAIATAPDMETNRTDTEAHQVTVTYGDFIINIENEADIQSMVNILTAVKEVCC